jgi:hypothetical protein
VDRESVSLRPATRRTDNEVDGTALRFEHPPQLSRASMAEHASLTESQRRCLPLRLTRDWHMSDRVHAAVNTVEATGGNSPGHGAGTQPASEELVGGNDPVLPAGNACDAVIDEFFPHTGNKSSHVVFAPSLARSPQ